MLPRGGSIGQFPFLIFLLRLYLHGVPGGVLTLHKRQLCVLSALGILVLTQTGIGLDVDKRTASKEATG